MERNRLPSQEDKPKHEGGALSNKTKNMTDTVYFSTDARFKYIHSVVHKCDYRESHYGKIPQLASLVSQSPEILLEL